MTHKKFGCFLLQSENNYWDAGKITDPGRGGVYILRDFQKSHKWPKSDPRLFFLSNLFIDGQAFIILGKKNTDFFSIVQGSAREKTYKLLSIRGFTLLIREKQLWNYCNIYESVVSITSPRKTITGQLKEIKMVKTESKKGSKPNFLFACS